jgi:hypothetical protein
MSPSRDVAQFVEGIGDGRQRDDSRILVEIMERVTGEPPRLWGKIVGFGDHRGIPSGLASRRGSRT